MPRMVTHQHKDGHPQGPFTILSLLLDQMADMLKNLASAKRSYMRDPVMAIEHEAPPVSNVMARQILAKEKAQPKNPKILFWGRGQKFNLI